MSDKDLFEFLKMNQFSSCLEYSLSEQNMGNKVDAFCNGDVLLRIVVDRGQKFIDLTRVGVTEWVDIFALALQVDSNFICKTGSFNEAVRVLIKYWPLLEPLLTHKTE